MTYPAEIQDLLGDASPSGAEFEGAPRSVVPADRGAGRGIVVSGDRAMVGGAYEGASLFDAEVATWSPHLNSADMDILPEKAIADARTRDTIRNDAYVAGGATLHKDNIVGAMFLLNSKPVTRALGAGFDDAWETEFQEEVEAKFTLAAESHDNWLDASRMNTLTGMVRLAVGVFCACGEVLTSVEWLSKDPSRPFSTAVQMIDTDRLSNPSVTGMMNSAPSGLDIFTLIQTGQLRAGVERDTFGAPQAYWVRTRHPSDPWNYFILPQWKRVEARKPWGRPQMIHIIEQTRPDQTRGIPEMVSALKEMRTTKAFREITLQRAVAQATFAATVESELDTEAIFARLGAGQDAAAYDDAIRHYMEGYLGNVARFAGGDKALKLNGVRIPHMPPGSKLNINAVGGGDLGSEFEQSLLRYIAATLGVSYEQLSRDYTNTNYSSARAAINETWKFMQSRKRFVADRFAGTIYRLWLEEQINNGRIESLPAAARKPGWLYEDPLRLQALAGAEWIGASRGQIDELKETQAAVLRITSNLSTDEYELGRLGQDWRKVYRQRAREIALREKLGLPAPIPPAPPAQGGSDPAAAPEKPKPKKPSSGAAAEVEHEEDVA